MIPGILEHQKEDKSRPLKYNAIFAIVRTDTNKIYRGRLYTTKKRAEKEIERFKRHEAYSGIELILVEYIPKF